MAAALDRQGEPGIQKASQRALVGRRAPGPAPERPRRLRERDGRHRGRQPRLRRAPRALGPGHPVPDRRGVRREGVRRRHRGDGARGEGPQVDGALPRPVRLLRRRRLPDARPRPRSRTRPQTYDRCAEAWQVVLRNIQSALEVTKADKCGRARAAAYSQFWGAHQRFFLHVLVAMSAPSLIRDMEAPAGGGRELRRPTRVHDGGGDRAGLRQGRQRTATTSGTST